jgi:malate dehydrogenase
MLHLPIPPFLRVPPFLPAPGTVGPVPSAYNSGRVHEVAIVGAGDLGGELTRQLARRDIVQRIRLIDEAGSVAAGKALDIMQSAPIERFSTQVSGATDVARAAGASVIVLADRSGLDSTGNDEWEGDEGLARLGRLTLVGSRTVIICAGANPLGLIEHGIRERGLPRHRIFGSAPEALVSAMRALVAVAVDGSPRDVSLTVLGIPPAQTVVPWEQVTIAGIAATGLIDEPARRRLAALLASLWPPGPSTLAGAAVAAIEAVGGRSHRTLSCFVGPDDTAGRRHRAAALPVKLNADGVAAINTPPLSSHDRLLLDNALLL